MAAPIRVCVCVTDASRVCFFTPLTDGARGPGQSQRGPDLHRHRPSPVHHSELRHHRRHVQGLCDRERNARPAHGPERSLLQAGYHGSTNQLTDKQQAISEACRRRGRKRAASSPCVERSRARCVTVRLSTHSTVFILGVEIL